LRIRSTQPSTPVRGFVRYSRMCARLKLIPR
jgi:hypothetical protein